MNLALVWWALITLCGLLQSWVALRLWMSRGRTTASALALVYALVCAYRSAFPKVDAERLCFWDSPFCSPALGRLLATVAEVSFGLLLTLYFGDRFFVVVASVANASCWVAVLSLNQLFHCVENSLWMLMGAYCFLVHRSATRVTWLCVPFVAYMCLVDVPMYYQRYLDHTGPYLTLWEGLRDAAHCAVVSRSTKRWVPEMMWMTPYFTVAVWFALWMGATLSERRVK